MEIAMPHSISFERLSFEPTRSPRPGFLRRFFRPLVIFGFGFLTFHYFGTTQLTGQNSVGQTASQGFALVELFTSEGCSSCPPADKVLMEIDAAAVKSGQPIYALSYHVDYWNYLGWEDPFSQKKCTERQQAYSRIFGKNRIYTPQMVINGKVEFVGSDRRRATKEIAAAIKTKSSARIQLQTQTVGGQVRVIGTASNPLPNSVMTFALVRKSGESAVSAGENTNRRLSHVNIVQDFQVTPIGTATATATFELPRTANREAFRIVAFLQSKDGHVAAAAESVVANQEVSP
jgi:hypothetical protein